MRMNTMQKMRNCSGTSLISLLVATTIMSFVAISMMGLLSLNTSEVNRTFNRADSLTAARVALDKMGRLIRMARTIGDVQGEVPPATDPYAAFPPGQSVDTGKVQNNNVDPLAVVTGAAVSSSAVFPSGVDFNYGDPSNPGVAPTPPWVGAWPWGGGGVNNPYRLDAQTLILQVQCFDNMGFPRKLDNGTAAPMPAMDTYVYKIVEDFQKEAQDPGATRWFRLELACFPAPANKTNMPPTMQAGVPQVVLTNIVGPVNTADATAMPAVFQYMDQTRNPLVLTSSFPTGSQNEQNLIAFRGIVVNLQVMNLDANRRASVSTVRSEMFLRNNATATIMGGVAQ